MKARGFDTLELARRLAARPWHDGPMTPDQERGFLKSVAAWERSIRRWLQGRSEPRGISQIRLVAAVLEVAVDELFPKEGDE